MSEGQAPPVPPSHSARRRRTVQPQKWKSSTFFFIDIAELAVLFAGALAFATGLLPALQSAGSPPATFLQVLPYWVPWGGAVGGVGISLVGVAGHSGSTWDSRHYAYWHLARPILGAVFGSVSVLMVTLIVKSITTGPTAEPPTVQQTAILTVIAFVVGYREETFRTLLRRVVDVIVGPGNLDSTAVVSFVPAVVDYGDVNRADGPQARTVHLFNGSTDTLRVASTGLTCGDPAVSVTPFAATDLAPLTAVEMTITWTPTTSGPLSTYVEVAVAGRAARLSLTGDAS